MNTKRELHVKEFLKRAIYNVYSVYGVYYWENDESMNISIETLRKYLNLEGYKTKYIEH